MQISLSLPPDLLALSGLASPGRAAVRVLDEALDAGIQPGKADNASRVSTVYLSEELQSRMLAAGATVDGMRAFSEGLIHNWAVAQRKAHASDRVAPLNLGRVDASKLRVQQRTLIEQVQPLLDQGSIVFQEASTGVGKSRALATIAHLRATAGEDITLATPTLALMTQLLEEFVALGLDPPAAYLGRGHFVDRERLNEVLSDPDFDLPDDQRQAIAAWDGHPLKGSPSARLARHVPNLGWLADDLLTLAPDMVRAAITFEDGEHDVYDALRETWFGSRIRVTTHSLLAVDMQLQAFGRGLVERYGCLLIDEAHLFEDAVSRTFSAALSLHTLRGWLARTLATHERALRNRRLRSACQRLLDTVTAAVKSLGSAASAGKHMLQGGESDDAQATRLRATLIMVCQQLVPDLERMAESGLPQATIATEAVRACNRILSEAPTLVTLSPVRRYPSITVGPKGLGRIFGAFWERVDCAALVSGTLMIDTQESGYSAGYVAGLLHVPHQRLTEARPIMASWLYTTPVVFIPTGDDVTQLVPPAYDENHIDAPDGAEAEVAYYKALARVVRTASHDAAGGTLVLCTSYRAVRLLSMQLMPILGTRLIEQLPGRAFASFEARYRAANVQGHRPVWIATGPAWTGLDLRDSTVPVSDDRLLTDLVVTRLPIMMAGSVYAALRSTGTALALARLEASFRLRQGMGRLVRAKSQQKRRLWVCDGRLWSPTKPNPYLCGPSLRAVQRYSRIEPMHLMEG